MLLVFVFLKFFFLKISTQRVYLCLYYVCAVQNAPHLMRYIYLSICATNTGIPAKHAEINTVECVQIKKNFGHKLTKWERNEDKKSVPSPTKIPITEKRENNKTKLKHTIAPQGLSPAMWKKIIKKYISQKKLCSFKNRCS